jgi:hypothetical protein
MVDNVRIDDHAQQGDDYLVNINTDPIGNYKATSFDPSAIMTIEAQVNSDGNYSTEMFDAQGNKNEVIVGGHKYAADNSTKTIINNSDENYGGGVRLSTNNGKAEEHAGDHTSAHDGVTVVATSQAHKVITTGGDGHHIVQGDQSFLTIDGGVHNYASNDYSISTSGVMTLVSEQDFAVYITGNEGHIINANLSFDVTGSGYIVTEGSFTANSTGAMAFNSVSTLAANSTGAMSLNTQSTLSGKSISAMTFNSPTSITMTCGAGTISMKPSQIELSIGGSSITLTAASITALAAIINLS